MSDGSMCIFSAEQELLASSNLNIHKSGEKTLGSVPNSWSITLLSPLLPALRTRPLRVCLHCSQHFPILSLRLCPYLFHPPSRSVRQISEQLINEFNARIHAHIMCQLGKEPQLQGRSYNLDGHSSCAGCEVFACVFVAACSLLPGCHLSPLP